MGETHLRVAQVSFGSARFQDPLVPDHHFVERIRAARGGPPERQRGECRSRYLDRIAIPIVLQEDDKIGSVSDRNTGP
jgi:hypothetical protein